MGKLEKTDLTYLSWTKTKDSSGTAGSFLKSQFYEEDGKYYYKLSAYDSVNGIAGHESINEVIVSRVLDIIGIDHVPYEPVYAEIIYGGKHIDTYLCRSRNFKNRNETKIALDALYEAERDPDESPLDFCRRMGWSGYIYDMLIVDFLILNRDRHGANIEILRDSKRKTLRPAPLFDHGVALTFSCHTLSSIKKFDVMSDPIVNNFIGGTSVMENLKLVPKSRLKALHPLKDEHREIVFDGLRKSIPKELQDKIWEMLMRRWEYIEGLCGLK